VERKPHYIFSQNATKSFFSFAYTFKKEGPHTKIIEYDLTKKQQLQHDAINLTRPDVLSSRAVGGYYNERRSGGDASDDSEEEEEHQGRTTMSDDSFSDQESDSGHRVPSSAQLPKAANGKTKTSRGRNERIMSVEECRAHLRLLFSNESQIMSLLFGRHGVFASLTPQGSATASADIFFLEVLPVSPTRFRPPAKMGDSLFEHPHNELLAKILNTSYRIRDINVDLKAATTKASGIDMITQRKMMGNLLEALIQLQVDVNSFMDSGKNPAPVRQGKLPTPGVKQILEKKEGLFRMNMMVVLLA
jgi:DNA-directed RNA polymerase beta' subunit